ncbi:hypothetical protein T03_10716 [Trichinella britovi]|uniref:Uncharacterized protein n=1 Tax=Trichinella britovi TaxID=45882 RepID=A0A0V1D2I1_TRIBR|nr:hypothetical protein T03_10716 [Trichinella britovi]
MSSHEARTDANQCSTGVSMAVSRRPSVPLLITNNRCASQQFVFDSNGLRHQKICLVAGDSYGSDVFPCHARREPHLE